MRKLENTIENKAKFFAQYWGQKVLEVGGGVGLVKVGVDGWNLKHPSFFLRLKNPGEFITEFGENTYHKGSSKLLSCFDIDNLRRFGFAAPFLGLTISDLIDYGWIKLV